MHGSFNSAFGTQQSFFSEASLMEMTEESAKKIATLQAKLDKKLGPEYISQRPGPGGGPKLTYAEGWKIINLANEVFGFNGWSTNVVSITTDFIDYSEESRRYNVGVTAIVRVTLRDGVFHEDVGYGLLENSKSKGAALDKCKKEAVTDAVKRTLRNFGNLLGNCLYDKQYTQEVIKMKVPPPKFDRSELHRRPEFEEAKPNVSAAPTASNTSFASTSTSFAAGPSNPQVKSEPLSAMPQPPYVPQNNTPSALTSIPAYPTVPRPNATSTPNAKGRAPSVTSGQPTGLHTPVHTPAGHPAQANDGDKMAQNLANRHAARLKQIQEAQEAQLREDEAARAAAQEERANTSTSAERRVSFAAPAADTVPTAHGESSSAPTRAETCAGSTDHHAGGAGPTRHSPPQVTLRSSDTVPEADSDEYHFPSEDDAFLANLDLDALDEGIGRPIDFEEGAVNPEDGGSLLSFAA
ncbi:recombination protein Rad52 [Trametes cingulata]|nr:recombination protein Rad52 [Trametes cingulata]